MVFTYFVPPSVPVLSVNSPMITFEYFRIPGQREDLEKEVLEDYLGTMKLAIFKYIMLDPSEHDRLNIRTNPKDFVLPVIRAPVPWHQMLVINKQNMLFHFYKINPALLELRELWAKE